MLSIVAVTSTGWNRFLPHGTDTTCQLIHH